MSLFAKDDYLRLPIRLGLAQAGIGLADTLLQV